VSLTVVFLSVVASIALLLKHSPPPVKTEVRTNTVFVPLPAKEQPVPAAPAPAPFTATQPEKVFPFRNERPVASHDEHKEHDNVMHVASVCPVLCTALLHQSTQKRAS
jgi:hypothetical protein